MFILKVFSDISGFKKKCDFRNKHIISAKNKICFFSFESDYDKFFHVWRSAFIKCQKHKQTQNHTLCISFSIRDFWWRYLLCINHVAFVCFWDTLTDFLVREKNREEMLHLECKRAFNYMGQQSSLLGLKTASRIKVGSLFCLN